MNDKVLQAILRLRDEMSRPLQTARGNLETFGRATNENNSRLGNLTTGMKTVGKGAMVAGGAIMATVGGALAYSTKKAIEFESAFAGVKKTIDETSTTSYADISKSLIDMSTTMPQSASELSAIAEAGGQLGIKADDIAKFTKTVAMLGDTTNIVSEEAAISLARIAGITNMPISQLENLGSVIVELGNNTKTSEAEIVDFATRIAASASQVGISNAGIMAISATFSSLGINAEAGGTSVSKMLADMQKSVELGGSKLQQFAKVAGMTGSQFQQAFKKDAAGAFNSFLKGLGDVKKNGKSATVILDEMGIRESRMVGMLKAGANGHQQLTDNINMSNKAWKDHNALAQEAEVRYGTTESALKIMRNQIDNAGISIGTALLPFVRDLAQFLGKIANKFNELSPGMKQFIVVSGLITAAIGLVLFVGGGLLIFAASVTGAIVALGGVAGITAGILGILGGVVSFLGFVVGLLLNPFVLVTAIVALFALAYKKNFLGIRDITNKVCGWVKEQLHKVGDKLSWVSDAVKGLADWWAKLRDKINNNPIVATVKQVFKGSGDTGKAAMSGNLNTKKRKAFGGTITKNDTLARLHQGEQVLTKGESLRMNNDNNRGINIEIKSLTVREEADINKIAKAFIRELSNQRNIAVGGTF